ncbi:MAG: DNA repair protein RecO [Cyanobacteria bacterium P01_D01_bin.105]
MKQRTYKATGINLKAMPMGEADKMVTVLTKENGIVRAIAPGARKHKSRLSGRSGLFVVNEVLFIKGKSIDKFVQAETQQSFPGLSRDLAKLTASQYLAEIALAQALSDQPQEELYCLLIEHLARLERATTLNVLPCLTQATYHLLALAGVAPEVFRCCLSRAPLNPPLGDPHWQVAFSVSSGGVVAPDAIARLERDRLQEIEPIEREWQAQLPTDRQVPDSTVPDSQAAGGQAFNRQWYTQLKRKVSREVSQNLGIVAYLSGAELALMQQLSKPELVMTAPMSTSVSNLISSSNSISNVRLTTSPHFTPPADRQNSLKSGTMKAAEPVPLPGSYLNSRPALGASGPHLMWRHIEQVLRQYAQYQFDRPIKSAALIDTCFSSPTHAARA